MLRITRRRTRRRTRRGPGAGARTWRGLVWTPAPDPAEVRPRLSPASWTRARHSPVTFPQPLQCRTCSTAALCSTRGRNGDADADTGIREDTADL